MKKSVAFFMLVVAGVSGKAQRAQMDSISYYYNAIKSEPDPEKQNPLMESLEKYALKSGASGNGMLLNISRQMVAEAFSEKGNMSKTRYWIGRISDSSAADVAVLTSVTKLIGVNKLTEAEQLLMPSWEKLKQKGGAGRPSSGPFGGSGPSASDFANQYGVILYKKGEYKKAIPYLAPDGEKEGRGRRGGGELYALALAKAGETDKALEQMRILISGSSHHSEEFSAAAQKVFSAKYGNTVLYKALMDSVSAVEHKKLETKVAAMKANEAAPDFELKDINGKAVSLSSLRGKIVILDFWATWCQPCVASFPGMQKAVDYYRKDTSIVFMFIHTSDKSADPVGDVRNFMKYKKYRFDVYMDLRDKTTGQSKVGNDFKVRGIPCKFVIDKSGMIRYTNTGYISEEEAIPEISMMVESIR